MKYIPRLRSRHPSHELLRPKYRNLPFFPFKSIIRLGSLTELKDSVSRGGNRIEINTTYAISNSMNKYKMKCRFKRAKINTSEFTSIKSGCNKTLNLGFPIIAKNIFGSRGKGNYKLNDKKELDKFILNKSFKIDNYIFEKFYNYVREYRLHITENECFYACRKVLKKDTPKEHRWYRNSDYCNWILEDNNLFDKPINWNEIVDHSIRALKSVGLDVGAVDVKVQSATNSKGIKRDNCKFIIIEINSAPSFGEITLQKYKQILPKILNNKYEKYKEKTKYIS